jgi:SHS2 domain-containing protein
MYEAFPHTADVGLRIKSPNLNTLFAEAGQALFSVIVENLDDVAPRTSLEFNIVGCEPCYLLVDWLNELLFVFESRRLLLSKFEVFVGDEGLTAVGRGEPIDTKRHVLDHEVKAVTYHALKVERVNDGWLAEVVLDI